MLSLSIRRNKLVKEEIGKFEIEVQEKLHLMAVGVGGGPVLWKNTARAFKELSSWTLKSSRFLTRVTSRNVIV